MYTEEKNFPKNQSQLLKFASKIKQYKQIQISQSINNNYQEQQKQQHTLAPTSSYKTLNAIL